MKQNNRFVNVCFFFVYVIRLQINKAMIMFMKHSHYFNVNSRRSIRLIIGYCARGGISSMY